MLKHFMGTRPLQHGAGSTKLQSARLSRRVAAVAAIAAFGLQSTGAIAGNMSLAMTGIAAPIEIIAFSLGATRAASFSGGGGTVVPAVFHDLSFTAPESAATPLVWSMTARNNLIASAVLTIRSPATAQPISEWTFSNVYLTSAQIGQTSDQTATSQISLSYGKVSYRVYAADGSVSQQMCWDVTAGVAC